MLRFPTSGISMVSGVPPEAKHADHLRIFLRAFCMPSLKNYEKMYFYFTFMVVLPACRSVYHVHAVPPQARKGQWIPSGIRNVCELSCLVGAGT